MIGSNRLTACILVTICFCAGLAGNVSAAGAKKGDLVKVEYKACVKGGKIFYASDPAAVKDADKADWFKEPLYPGPEMVIAGEQTSFPRLGESLLGMAKGQEKTVTLAPEEAFGLPVPAKIKSFPREVVFARKMEMTPPEYVGSFGKFPVNGAKVAFNPYIQAEVRSFTEDKAVLLLSAEDNAVSEDEFGKTTTKVSDDEIRIILEPLIGAKLPGAGENGEPVEGRITSVNATSFTVDYNPPALGKHVVLDIRVLDVVEAFTFEGRTLDWREPAGDSLEEFENLDRPVLVVLQMEGCGWCRRYFQETMTDKRILSLGDKFVWVRVDAEKREEIAKQFNLSGTPLTVILDGKGKVLERFEGFQKAAVLYSMLAGLAGE